MAKPVSAEILEAVAEAAVSSPLVRSLNTDGLREISSHGSRLCIETNEPLYKTGDPPDCFYIVLRGSVALHNSASAGGGYTTYYGAGSHFGSLDMLRSQGRSGSATAAVDCELLAIPYDFITEAANKARDRSFATFVRTLLQPLVVHQLNRSPSFRYCATPAKRDLARTSRLRMLRPHDIVFEFGQIAQELMFLVAGELEAVQPNEDSHVSGIVRPGETVGETSLLESRPLFCTIRARSRSWILRVPRHRFAALARDQPLFLEQLCAVCAEPFALRKINWSD